MNCSRKTTPLILLLSLSLLPFACKKQRIVDCLPGQVVRNQQCVFLDSTAPPVDATSDLDAGNSDLPIITDDMPSDTGGDTTNPGDTADGEVVLGKIGAACSSDELCEQNLCFPGPNGYCSTAPCEDDCPDAAECLLLGSIKACYKPCNGASDCRAAEGYACKHLIKTSFPLIKYTDVCRPTGDAKLGDACVIDSECVEDFACLPNIKKGYCTRVECSNSSDCPSDSKCVIIDKVPACLKSCGGDGDCRTGDDHACVTLKDLSNVAVKVCAMKEGNAKLGEVCEVNFDCGKLVDAGAFCKILATGTCNDTQKTLCTTHADCPVTNQISGQCTQGQTVGTCAVPCDPGTGGACTSGFCANYGGQHLCIVECTGASDTCPQSGFKCVVGGIVGDKYGCMLTDGGEVGDVCETDGDCDGGSICLLGGNYPGGYCSRSCANDGTADCVFPGVCVNSPNGPVCAKRCDDQGDCRAGYSCKTTNSSSQKICWKTELP